MENKYYTPTIDEFYVGFECEQKIDNKWYEQICKDYYISILTNESFKPDWNSFRVKYLDKEDIESLGWKWDKHKAGFKNKDDIHLIYWLDEDNKEIVIEAYGECVFQGTIKNKSELKKLMKQLGIYE